MGIMNEYTEREVAAEIIRALAEIYIDESDGVVSEGIKDTELNWFFMVMGKVAENLNLGISFQAPPTKSPNAGE